MQDNYHISDAGTLVSLPAIIAKKSSKSLIFPGSEAAPQAAGAQKTEGIKISPMRMTAIRSAMRATSTPMASQSALKSALSQLFMIVMAWFHSHDESVMDPELVRALQRIHDGGRGIFVDPDRLFVDLRLVEKSPAAHDAGVAKAIQAAEQALLQ